MSWAPVEVQPRKTSSLLLAGRRLPPVQDARRGARPLRWAKAVASTRLPQPIFTSRLLTWFPAVRTRDEELGGDFLVRPALRDKAKDVQLRAPPA